MMHPLKNIICFVTVLFLMYCNVSFAEPASHLSLRECILIALRYNQIIQNSELQRIVDKFNIAVAENQFEFRYFLTGSSLANESMSNAQPWVKSRNYTITPSISRKTVFGTTFTGTLINPLNWNNTSNSYVFNPTASLSVSHPILRGSGVLINESPLLQAYNTEGINRLNYKNIAMTTVTTIIADYYNVVQSENSLVVDQEALKSAKKTVEQNTIRIQNGFMAPSENVQAEFAVAQQELQVVTDINNIVQTKLQLLQDMGLSSSRKIEVDKEINTNDIIYPEGEYAKQLLFTHNISYLNALLSIENNKLSLLQAEDSQRWQLDLNATLQQGPGSGGSENAGYKSLFNGRNVNRSIGLTLNIPIDDLASQQNVVGAKVGYDQNKLQLKQLRMQLESSLIGTLEQLAIAKTQILLAKRSQDLANKSYQDSLIRLNYGKVSLFEVTTLQTNLISAQITYINTEISFLNLIATYQLNLGITLDVWNIQLKY